MDVERQEFGFLDAGNKEIYTCPKCKLYWLCVDNKEIEFRLSAFKPYKPKLCPYCKDPNKKVPKELIEFRKKLTNS